MDTPAVAKDLAHGLEFAEQVISEVNSLVVIIDHNFNILRFNRLCEEVTGLSDKDVNGRQAHDSMSLAERETSRPNLTQLFNRSVYYDVERPITHHTRPRTITLRKQIGQSDNP